MNQRDCVIKSIEHKSTNTIPYQLDLTLSVHEKLCDYYEDDEFLYTNIGNHLIREKNKNHRIIDPLSHQDIFGVIWKKEKEGGDIGIVSDYLLKEPQIEPYVFPKPDAGMIKSKCEHMIANHPSLFKIYEIGFSLFERAWTLRGMESLLMDFIQEEEFVDELLDAILEYNLGVIELAAQYPIDCIMFGDDWGQQKGLIMGPKLWKRFIKPRMEIMYKAVKGHGLYVAHHSCGDNYELFRELIEMGLDIYNTFQPEIYDMDAFKKEFGKQLTIYGGISTQGLLAHGTPAEVRETTKRTMDALSKDGGYIVAPTHQCTSDIPLKNIFAFVETVQQQ